MIDTTYYKQAENIAKNDLPSWVLAKKYNLEAFEKFGFPVHIDNIQQTFQIYDTMQENRFTSFMKEIHGFSKNDLDLFTDIIIECLEFQKIHFPTQKSFIPFDTLINSFIVFKRIQKINPKITNILDIGPGTASFSFFLKYFKSLKEYTYTDACESFYLLQNNVNSFLFKSNFSQHVLMSSNNETFSSEENELYKNSGIEKKYYLEFKNNKTIQCHAYPWWKLGKLNKKSNSFDIITTNANLREFSEGALDDYLNIIHQKLSSDGIIFAHCIGSGALRSTQYLYDKLYDNNFAIICNLHGNNSYKYLSGKEIQTFFTLDNLIFVKKGHPLYEKYHKKINLGITSRVQPEEYIYEALFPTEEEFSNNKLYSKEEIYQEVSKKLKAKYE